MKYKTRRWYAVLTVCLIAAVWFGAYQYAGAKRYKIQLENQYRRSFGDMLDYVGNIGTDLKKGKAVTDSAQMTSLSSEIRNKAMFAQEHLSHLPIRGIEMENTSKFLSQVGDYTYRLSEKMLRGETVTAEEKQTMKELERYASGLYDELQSMQNGLYAGTMTFEQAGKRLFRSQTEDFPGRMESVEEEFADYPSLLYDGPFSDHIGLRKSGFLDSLPAVSPADAEETVRDFLSFCRIVSVNRLEDGDGTVETYSFQVKTDEEEISIAVSKRGGYPVWMLNQRQISRDGLTTEEAMERAKRFLEEHQYAEMRENYYERIGNALVVNFAYQQDGITVYPDLIKVKVSLEDGEIVGFESGGYLMNHEPHRTLPEPGISPDEAAAIVSDVMKTESCRLTLIPTESKQELLCYELKGTIDQDEYLIYLNAENGRQEKILLLLVSESGTLTV